MPQPTKREAPRPGRDRAPSQEPAGEIPDAKLQRILDQVDRTFAAKEWLDELENNRAEEAADELLAETDRALAEADRALTSAARHGDRIDALLAEIRDMRTRTNVA